MGTQLHDTYHYKYELIVQPLTPDWLDFEISLIVFLPEPSESCYWQEFTEVCEKYYAYLEVYKTERWGRGERQFYILTVIPHQQDKTRYFTGRIQKGEELIGAIESISFVVNRWNCDEIIELYRRCGYKTNHGKGVLTFRADKPMFPDR